MRVVSDTSPICNLAIIGRLELLRRRYGTVVIPIEVANELSALSHTLARERINTAITAGWIVIKPSPKMLQLPYPLDAGEAAAIALARAEQSDILLMDEKHGRIAARSVGIKVAGVLGELIYAKRAGLIPLLKPEIDLLRKEARFFIALDVERLVLTEVGE